MVSSTAQPDRPSASHSLTDRHAVRFLLDHRLGRLLTEDPATGEPFVTPVHYVADRAGGFVTTLPVDSAQAAAIRAGGRSLLSVSAHRSWVPRHLNLADVPPREAIWHVQADVAAEIIDDPAVLEETVRRQIASVLEPLPQQDKSDPLPRASRSALSQLVAVRLRVIRLRVKLRDHAA